MSLMTCVQLCFLQDTVQQLLFACYSGGELRPHHSCYISQSVSSLSHPIRLVVNCLPGGSQVSGDVPLATHFSLVQSQTQIVDVLTLLGCHCSNLCHTLMLICNNKCYRFQIQHITGLPSLLFCLLFLIFTYQLTVKMFHW